jgi:pyruvate, water dikinase
MAMRHVFASLYNDRAISYRVHKGYEHAEVALSAGVQRMVRSDLGASGVMFTLDTESGFDKVVFITSAYGLGEAVVQGAGQPRRVLCLQAGAGGGRKSIVRRSLGGKAIKMVFTDAREAGRSVKTVDVRRGRAQPLLDHRCWKWSSWPRCDEDRGSLWTRRWTSNGARDGEDGKLYILQARPETVKANADIGMLRRYRLTQKSELLTSGRAIGQKVGSGRCD